MAFETNAGATFGVSAAAPATYNEAGYEALTFTSVTAAAILSYNGPQPEWDVATDDSYNTASKADLKTSRKLGDAEITLKYDIASTGFNGIIETAEASKTAVLSLQFAKGNAVDFVWYTAQVKKATVVEGGANDFETYEISFNVQTDKVVGTA